MPQETRKEAPAKGRGNIASRCGRYLAGAAAAIAIFAYVGLGDFDWVTLTGPLEIEPKLSGRDTAGFIVSPALHAWILRGMFLLLWAFFSQIPSLCKGVARHLPLLLYTAACIYGVFAFIAGDFFWAAYRHELGPAIRIVSVLAFAVLVCAMYDADGKTFLRPKRLTSPVFLTALLVLLVLCGLCASLAFSDTSWINEEGPIPAFVRLGMLCAAFVGASLAVGSPSSR